MREIKFRAWDKIQKWMTGVVCLNMGTWVDVVLIQPKVEKATYNQVTENVELMQYTGLKDKNGKEIYEGDIIKGRDTDCKEYPYIIDVKWDKKLSGWSPLDSYTTNGVNDREDGYFDISFCEVIGNIYENPELLKNL